MSKIEKLLKLATEFKPGAAFKLRGFDAKVTAYSDEHMFLTIPEAAVDPDEIDVAGKRVRDRELDNARDEIRRLNMEMERMLADPYYADDRRRRYRYEQDRRRDYYDSMDYMRRATSMMDIVRDPFRKGPVITEGAPKPPGEAAWIDPLAWREPSQKKR